VWATQLTSAARALGDAFRAVVLSDHVGYSSLAALKQWPIAQLKIDLFFLRGIPGDPNDEAMSKPSLILVTRSA
jgi:EAL domain-containing protein (putative c-di-GMP-specific phosphodiesterase class I)